MSIVSAKIDFYRGGQRTFANRDLAVQKRARDFGEEPCPDFEMAETTARQSQSLKIRRHGNQTTNQPLSYVPLKCNQEFSHVEGASLFNAPVHGPVAQLKIPQEYARHLDVRDMYAETEVNAPPPLLLKRGIRPEARFLKIDRISEPTDILFKPNYEGAGASHYNFPKVSYDVGNAELRRLFGA
jgi:hypothetical protein